jgi:hypothetical protein
MVAFGAASAAAGVGQGVAVSEADTAPRIRRMLRECKVSAAPALWLAAACIALVGLLVLG